MTIKAIETVYNGYRFRSRLEARWAVFFDTIGIKYEYEPEGYDLGKAGCYLPDFWIPGSNFFVEIKGETPPSQEIDKYEALHQSTTFPVVVLVGPPWGCQTYLVCTDTDSGGGGIYSIWLNTGCNTLSINSDQNLCIITHDKKSERVFWGADFTALECVFSDYTMDSFKPLFHLSLLNDLLDCAAIKAKQARFEHGETGL